MSKRAFLFILHPSSFILSPTGGGFRGGLRRTLIGRRFPGGTPSGILLFEGGVP